MKTTKTLITMLLLAGSTFGMASSKEVKDGPLDKENVEIVTKEQGLFNLVYKTASSGTYKVNIYDKSGKNIFTEQFASEKSFSKVYNFKNLAHGTYTMEVVNNSLEKITKEIVYETSSSLKVNLSSLDENGKFNLVVTGVEERPVKVVILDEYDRSLYEETIDIKSSFRKPFNVSRVNAQYVKFRVLAGNESVEKLVKL